MENGEFENLSKELMNLSNKIDKSCQYNAEKMVVATSAVVFLLEKIEITDEEKSRILSSLGRKYIDNDW